MLNDWYLCEKPFYSYYSYAFFIVRLKFQKLSALKFVSRTIPHSGGYKTLQFAAELFPKLALGFIPVIISN